MAEPMFRETRPAVGYVGQPFAIGTTIPVVVSFTVRIAVKGPASVLPVVVSVPTAVPATVRCVLLATRPVTTRSLLWLIVEVALSRCVTVPLTSECAVTLFVRLSIFAWGVPPAVLIDAVTSTVRPRLVTGPQGTTPVLLANTQLLPTLSEWNGPWPIPSPNPMPPKN